MLIDAATIPNATTLSGDICIIGAGAAGITVARELADSQHRVILLESGPFDYDEGANDLNAGRSVGRPYLDLSSCRQRFFGGTTNHWSGSCLPLEPIDFERGWPFSKSELDPFYGEAQRVLQLGPYDYRVASWGITPDDVPDPFKGPHFIPKMMQNSPPTRFRTVYGPGLKNAERTIVYLNATVTGLCTGPDERRVQHLEIATPSGNRLRVEARAYVLACGGVENARVLLLSGDQARGGLGNTNGLVGRNFMVHLQCPGGTIALADPYTDLSFYTNVVSNGRAYAPFNAWFASFVGLSETTMRIRNLPNCRVMWDFHYREPAMRTILAFRRATRWSSEGDRWSHMAQVMSDLGDASTYVYRRIFTRVPEPVDSLSLIFTFEQTPNRESQVRLGTDRDALGQRRVELDWRVAAADKEAARQIARLLGTEVGRVGLGRMRSLLEDEDWPADMFGDQHHMGTTIMSKDPASGVVDPDCRMHEVDNLWIAGSSVFPRAGFSNPTLTIAALAVRLARHLRARLA